MRNKLRQLSKDSVVYGFGGVVARSLAFILLPVYTRIFTPSQYGNIEMLNVLSALLSTLLAMGMDSAMSYYFYEKKSAGEEAQKAMITSILQWRITWGVLLVVAATLLTPWLNAAFFGGGLSWPYFAIAFSGALFTQFVNQSAEVYRLLYRPWGYIIVTMNYSALSAIAAIALAVGLKLGMLGYFIGMLSGAFISAIFGWFSIRRYIDFSRWHRFWWPELVRFGFPLVPAALLMWVSNTADRWFILAYHGQSAMGLYAIGAKFATLIVLATEIFRRAWWPVAMEALQNEDGPALFRMIARLYMGLGMIGVVWLTAFSPWLMKFMTAPAFRDAYPIVGMLAFSSIFYGFLLISAAGIWKVKKNWWTTLSMAVGAAINVLLNWFWVPAFGSAGAAAATATAMLVSNVMAMVVAERFWSVRLPVWTLGGQISIAVVATACILRLYSGVQLSWLVLPVAMIASLAIGGLAAGRGIQLNRLLNRPSVT